MCTAVCEALGGHACTEGADVLCKWAWTHILAGSLHHLPCEENSCVTCDLACSSSLLEPCKVVTESHLDKWEAGESTLTVR